MCNFAGARKAVTEPVAFPSFDLKFRPVLDGYADWVILPGPSGQYQAASFGRWDGIAKLLRSIDPETNGILRVAERVFHEWENASSVFSAPIPNIIDGTSGAPRAPG